MKKFLYILIVLLLVLTACSSNESKGVITYLELNEYEQKLESNDKFFVVIGNIDCPACQRYKPILEEINKNKDLEIFYVEIDDSKWSDEDKTQLLDVSQEKLGFSITGTPTSFIVDNKQLQATKVGYLEYGEILDILVEHGLVES